MHFLLSSMSVGYMLTTSIPDDGDDATMDQIRKRAKWDNDDYVCRGLILKIRLILYLIFSKLLNLEKNYGIPWIPNIWLSMHQNKLLGILGRFTQHKINMDEAIQVSCIIDKLPPSWKDFKDKKKELTLVELGSQLGNKKYFVTFIDDASRFCYVSLLHTKDEALDKLKVFKTEVELQQGSLIKRFRTDRGGPSQGKPNLNDLRGCREVVRLPDPKLKTLGKRGIECIFVIYTEHFKAFRYYVIEPNDSVAINSIIESRDTIFDENRLSSVPRPSLCIPKGTEDIDGSVVPEVVTDEVVQQPESELRKSKGNRTPKDFRPKFQLYLIEGTRDEKEAINDEMDSIMGNNTWVLADLPPGCKPFCCKWIFKRKLKYHKTANCYGINSQSDYSLDRCETAFLNGDLDEEVPKQWHQKYDEVVLSNGYLLKQADKYVYRKFDEYGKGVIIYLYVDDMLIFGTDQVQVDLTKEFLSLKFSMKDMGDADVILGIRIKHESNGIAISQSHYIEKDVSQLEYSRVIGYLMYDMTCTRPDIAFVIGKLSKYTLVTLYSTLASNSAGTEVFLLGGGAISWASKKQTCITGSTMESEFVALATAGKEAKWLKNLLLEISLWSKPIAPIFILYDSAATLAKAYSQMYNGKFRPLSVRHCMIHKLITNGVISIEFVRSQQKLADYLTKELARELVIKSAEGMGLKGLHMYLHIIPRMCLEPAEKEDEVVNFLMVNFFEKVLSRSMNKEEPPM
ncbi:zinc finger, CCHC-type containing protein [Tanacetum coccineum]